MKTTSLVTLATTLLTFTALAGSEALIRERARGIRDANNASQGVPVPVTPAQPATPMPTPAPGLAKVQADLIALKPGTTATAAQKEQLAQHLTSVAEGTSKTNCAAAPKLAEALVTALSEHALPAANRARLMQELDALLNPGKYPQAKPEGIYADIQLSFQGIGASRAQATAIIDGIKALAAEAR